MTRRVLPPLIAFLLALAGCASADDKNPNATSIAITNKIASLPAGQTHQFNVVILNDQGAGYAASVSGGGSILGQSATGPSYLAPAAPPSPNAVTVRVTASNGSGVYDTNTFSIDPPPGPVVSLSPTSISVNAGDPPTTLSITVTQDDPANVLTASVGSAAACGGPCGSFGAFSGAAGGGAYTVPYNPPASVSGSTIQEIHVASSLANATPGTADVFVFP